MNANNYLNRVINGEVLGVLKSFPDNFIDIGVTSPPYNKGENKKGWLVENVKYSGSTDRLPEDLYQKNQIEVLDEIFRITKPGGSFFYNHKVRWERGFMIHPMDWLRKTKWVTKQEIIWDRMIAANIRGWRFWQVEERIYWLYKPQGQNLIGEELKSKHALLTSIWRLTPEKQNPHPAPFPLALPLRVIYSILDENKGIVIDPYCGSGTTLVAAKILGHDFIGIDISREYVEFSEKRLKFYTTELKNADEETSKHLVLKTFEERKSRGEFTGRYANNGNKVDSENSVLNLNLFQNA